MPNVALVTAKAVETSNDDSDMEASLAALAELGIDASARCWDDPTVDWQSFQLAILRSTWDYVDRYDEFLDWLTLTEGCVRVLNPAPIVRWNLDKHYLRDLVAQKIPVVPTAYVEPGSPIALPDWGGDIVVKPAIGAGAKDATRVASTSEAMHHVGLLHARGRTAMVQPYLAAIDIEGEVGLVYFNGRFSHAFEKAPLLESGVALRTGELFEHEAITRCTASDAERALGELVVATYASDLLYARIDVIPDSSGSPVVLELELVEPSFYLHVDDDAPMAFALAVTERLSSVRADG